MFISRIFKKSSDDKGNKESRRCSECGKPKVEVAALLPYREGFICDMCVLDLNRERIKELDSHEEVEKNELSEDKEAENLTDDEALDEFEEVDSPDWNPLGPVNDDYLDRMVDHFIPDSTIEHIDLTTESIDPEAVALIPKAVAEEFCIMPIRKEGDKLLVAFGDPADEEALKEVKHFSGMTIDMIVADPEDIQDAIDKYYEA